MRKKISLAKKILAVLKEALLESAGIFLTIQDIAKAIYGDGYMRKTAHIFNTQIRNNMYAAQKLAEENGMIIIPLRKPVKDINKPDAKFRIIGWKIAEEGDEKYIVDELLFKKRKGEEHSSSFIGLKNRARRQGILPKEKLKELSM